MKERDPDFYKKIGAKGGAASLGRHHTKETKRKISDTKRRKRWEAELPNETKQGV